MIQSPTIFLSYSWANQNIADSLDSDFQAIGITFKKDIRDIGFKDSLLKYMDMIRETDIVLMLISDSFLKSTNCMYEVLEFVKEKNYQNKLLPIILKDAKIFSADGRLSYIKYWDDEYHKLEKKCSGSRLKNLGTLSSDLALLDNICSNSGEFLKNISHELSVTFEELKKNNYKQILDYIGFENVGLLEKVFK